MIRTGLTSASPTTTDSHFLAAPQCARSTSPANTSGPNTAATYSAAPASSSSAHTTSPTSSPTTDRKMTTTGPALAAPPPEVDSRATSALLAPVRKTSVFTPIPDARPADAASTRPISSTSAAGASADAPTASTRNPTDSPTACATGTPRTARFATAHNHKITTSTDDAANTKAYSCRNPALLKSTRVVEPTNVARPVHNHVTASAHAFAMNPSGSEANDTAPPTAPPTLRPASQAAKPAGLINCSGVHQSAKGRRPKA